MTEAANRIANLTQAKLAFLLEKVKQRAREDARIPAIARRGEGDCFPLSYAQQRLWLLEHLNPGTPLFNVPAAWRLEGQLDVKALESALTEICRRHESLRTNFVIRDHQPVQLIAPPSPVALPFIDLTALPASLQQREAKRIGAETQGLPFDLGRGPLMRLRLLKLGEEWHELVLVMHHIITDGWSFSIFLREVSVLYDAYKRGESSPLTELEVQYGDYAAWQRERLQGETLERQLSYWKEHLSGAPLILELSTQRPRRAARSHRGDARLMILSAELTEQIRTLNQREGVTLYITMLAAFQALLCRYSGQEKISVGSPLAGRKCRQTEALIGFFINTLVLRTDVSGNPTFRELLARVRDLYLAAHAHQDVPFQSLVAELQPDRSLGQTPFFQVWFALQNVRQEKLRMDGLTLSPINVGVKTAQFDLALIVREESETINAFLIYDTDLFDAENVMQILKDYKTLLQQATAQPQRRVLEIPLDRTADEQDDLATFSEGVEEPEDQFVF